MSIKLVAVDMDGTLLNSRKEQPPDFIPWVIAHPQIKTVIASGRQYYTLRSDFTAIADRLCFIAENGGLVFEQDKLLYCNAMSKDALDRVLDRLASISRITPILAGSKAAYMCHTEREIEEEAAIYYHRLVFLDDLHQAAQRDSIVKIAVYVADGRTEQVCAALGLNEGSVKAVISGVNWIDIANSSVSKGAAIHAIQRGCSISPAECMAFGDYLNDLELLQACDESYCMANGHRQLKAAARYIAASNDDDGVMRVLRTLPETAENE